MQNAWCAIRGAVNEINAVLLSEDDDEEEDEEQQVAEAAAGRRLPAERDLPLLLQQQQQQQEAIARQLELSESETAKYAQQLASLRKECRQLRSRLATQQQQQQQQQQSEDTGNASGAAAAAAAGSSRESSNLGAAQFEDLSQPLQRLAQALRVPASQLASQLATPGTDPWDVYEELCSSLERTVKMAEFINVEWEHTKGSATFQTLLARPLVRTLPAELRRWLHSPSLTAEGSVEGAPGAPWGALAEINQQTLALVGCIETAKKLVQCAGALSVAAGSLTEAGGPPMGAPHSRGGSAVATPRASDEVGSNGEGPPDPVEVSEAERRLRQEVAKRLQLQHQTAALHRRVLELTEDLKDAQERIEEQREAERERAKHAGSEETEGLKEQLGRATEQLETVRRLYKELLANYEKRQSGNVQDASEELTGENKDLLLQLRSWQASHAAVSRALQEALGELADLRGEAARVHALEKELETVKRETGRLEEIREIQSLSEVELIKAHSERDEMEKELRETKMAVEKYARALKRVQTDCDATVNRLRTELTNTQNEMQAMKSDIGANETLKTKIEDLEKQLAEAEQQRNQAAATAKKLEEDNKTISEGMQKLLQKLHAQVDDQDYFVDKRIVAQMIAKHQEMHGNIKRRDEIFLLICDVLGFSDEERERYGLPRKQSERGKESGGLSEQFVEFLNGEVS